MVGTLRFANPTILRPSFETHRFAMLLRMRSDHSDNGDSRQFRFVEKWLPGERLLVGLVKMSILQKLADTSEIFTKE
jgi:hypothetical protein